MANTVIALKKSGIPSAVPGSLANGELAINYADGRLFYKAANGTIASISTGSTVNDFGTVNAGGTLLVADTTGDVLDVRAGQNIIITGDAVNDRMTINADLTAANSWANTKLSNGTVTLAGALTTTQSITANGYVIIGPSDGLQEGGEIQLLPAGNYINWILDAYQNNHRIFTRSDSTLGNINFFHANGGAVRMAINKSDPAYTLDVSGDVNISGTYRVNGTPISSGTTDLTPANNWANTLSTSDREIANAAANSANIYGMSFANTKLANTSGVSFAGDLYFPTGNVAIGLSTTTYRLDVSGKSRIGRDVAQGNPSTTDILANAHTAIGGQGGNYLSIGQYGSDKSYAQWIQSSFTNPTSATYNLILQPIGGRLGIGNNAPGYTVDVAGDVNITGTYRVNGTALPSDLTPANNWANTVATAGNNYTNSVGAASNTWANSVSAASNAWANTLTTTDRAIANAAANSANAYTVTVGASANNWANNKLANTSGVSFAGDLYFPTGNIGVGSGSSAGYRLYVNGSFAANTKSFVIDHPTKPDMKLRHGSLEGPENGVYVRGKLHGGVINLPDYWVGLVDEDTITVQLTAIGHSQNPYVVEVSNNNVFIDTENHTEPYCYFTVYGERKDVEKLVVEY